MLGSEILYRDDLEPEALFPSFVASIVGFSIFGAVEGFDPIFGTLHAAPCSVIRCNSSITPGSGSPPGSSAASMPEASTSRSDYDNASPGPGCSSRRSRGLAVGLIGLGFPVAWRRVMAGSNGGCATGCRHTALVDPALDPVRQDPGDVIVHRLRRIRWHLRPRHGHRRVYRPRPYGACSTGSPLACPLAGAVHGRGHDRLLREHRARTLGVDAHGGRDDRQPRAASTCDARHRACHIGRRGRHDLRESAPQPSRRAGAPLPPLGSHS